MLLYWILGYVLVNIFVGWYSSRLVKDTGDFMLAGKRLPLGMATFTVFATWFGSETLLGASSKVGEGGLLSVIEDPFGAALCLLLVGLFFAKKLYRLNLLTFGDYFRKQFGKKAEVAGSIFMVFSYFGWVAAQMVAVGIIFSLVGGVDRQTAVVSASLVVIAYTLMGGMWAVSITDTLQTLVIIAGISFAAMEILPQAGGWKAVMDFYPESHFRMIPERGIENWLEYIAAWATIGLGSIPSQDVYQRVMSSKNEKVAVRSTVIAAFLYLTIGMIPLVLGLAAKKIGVQGHDIQVSLPLLIMNHVSFPVQVLFFGALLSAVMSTTSGAILAPASILSKNLIRPLLPKMDEKRFLLVSRGCVLMVGVISLAMALHRQDIYELVGEASVISLVSLLIPLVGGMFFNLKSESAAVYSMMFGFAGWLVAQYLCKITIPPVFVGLVFGFSGLAIGRITGRIHRG